MMINHNNSVYRYCSATCLRYFRCKGLFTYDNSDNITSKNDTNHTSNNNNDNKSQ